ncbi:MAG: NAD(P)/FAD-dependent oxidoreductase [Sphingobacteriia bacterium]|nr:MAG: NAD(P)/FAD-dependent oxidoreductase [Sphingobacteriia bacterium]
MSTQRIVILGAGFAGLQIARRLSDTSIDITLIDQYNFHQFQPLMYQVATARLEPSSISFPLRKVFQHKKQVHVRLANIESIDSSTNKVNTDIGVFEYDQLIIATGCTTNYFGNKNIEAFAFPMKSTNEAIALRNHILLNFEAALTAAPDTLDALMNIVVVGGGPTGVELSGSLAELKKNILPKDYPDMDFSKLAVHLLEAGPAILGVMSKASQEKSKYYLEQMGVYVHTNTAVKDFDGTTVMLDNGDTITTKTMIWAAGITGNIPTGLPADKLVRGNRLKVDLYNRVEGYKNIYAVGDIAYMVTADFPKGHPQLANVAIEQAKNLVYNINQQHKEKQERPFAYKNPGTMATVGKRKAVVDLPNFSFQGRLAWFVWMFLHLMLIVSVKNRLIIFINWAISYFTNDTTLRLILLPKKKLI